MAGAIVEPGSQSAPPDVPSPKAPPPKEDLTALRTEPETERAKSQEAQNTTRTLQGTVQSLTQRLDKAQSDFLGELAELKASQASRPPIGEQEVLPGYNGELSEEGAALLRLLDEKIGKATKDIGENISTESATAKAEVQSAISAQSGMAQLKRDNPELAALLGPVAWAHSRENPDASVEECWNTALRNAEAAGFKPKEFVAAQREEAQRLSMEKPTGGGPAGASVGPQTPDEKLRALAKDLGLEALARGSG